jgi:hypothetical protein
MPKRHIKGKAIEKLKIPISAKELSRVREGRPLRPPRLKEAGYTYLGGTARRWRTPDGREVSRRQAYREIALPLMSAHDWERADALDGRDRAAFLAKKGFRIKRDREDY